MIAFRSIGDEYGDDETGEVGLPLSLHLEVTHPGCDALHLGALDCNAEALRLGEAGF